MRSLLFAILCCIPVAGCFREVREERQLTDSAYLRFPALEAPVEVELRGEARAALKFAVPVAPSARYEVPAGTWRITATRGGQVVMDRNLFVGAGETRSFDLR